MHLRTILLGAVLLGASGPVRAGPDPLDLPFPFEATETDVSQIAATLARRTALPVTLTAEGLEPVTVRNQDGSVRDLLDALGPAAGLVWWTDGVSITLEPQGGVKSRLVAIRGLALDEIRASLDALDLDDDRFPMVTTPDAGLVRIGGPAGYVDAVADLIETLVATRRGRTAGPASGDPTLPRIFRGGAAPVDPEAAPAARTAQPPAAPPAASP